MASEYLDVRSDLWRRWFAEAASYEDYLAGSPGDKAKRWTSMAAKLPPLSSEQKERLAIRRSVNVLLVSGVWCGDCVRQGPMIRQIAEACDPSVTLRVIDRDFRAELRDEVRLVGAMRVPVAVFLTEDFFEIGRFGDRTLTHYRKKASTELGPACPVPFFIPPEGELAAEQSEWVDVFERMLWMARLSPLARARHGD